MKYFIYLIAIIILLAINLGLFNNLQIKGQIPNLLFLTVLFFVLEKKSFDFYYISFVSGLFLDFFSTSFFGSFTLALLILCLVLHFIVNYMVVIELNWKTLSLFLAGSLFTLNILLWFFGFIAFKFNWTGSYSPFNIFMSAFPASFVYNWLLLYPMYLATNYLQILVDQQNIRRRGIVR